MEMKYTRDQGVVYGGSDPRYRDYNSNWPCWDKDNEAYRWNPSGPYEVFLYRRTHFHNCTPPRPTYDLSARFWANPGPDFFCHMPSGSLPPSWDLRCHGGVYW